MKKDIKFRAEYEGKIFKVASIDFSNEFGAQVCLIGNGDIQLCVNIDLVNLMQYTGLKDKKGNDTYDGDIVKSSDGLDEYVDEVTINHVQGIYFGKNRYADLGLPHGFEVVGNIKESKKQHSLKKNAIET